MISSHHATDYEAQPDEKKGALQKVKCQETSKSDGTNKVEEEAESEGKITGGRKWVFGKRLAESKQKHEEINHDDDGKGKSAKVGEVGMKTDQRIKEMRKLKAGSIIEVADTGNDAEAQQSSSLDVTDVTKAVMSKMELNNIPNGSQQPLSPTEVLSTALSKVHISSHPPRLRSKRGDGQGGYNRGRERRRSKTKHISPEQPKEVPMKNAVMMLNEMFPPPGANAIRHLDDRSADTPRGIVFRVPAVGVDEFRVGVLFSDPPRSISFRRRSRRGRFLKR